MAKIEQLTRLTMKGMEAQPSMDDLAKLEKAAKGTVLQLVEVFGIANKFKPGEKDGKQFIKFLGQFKGTNLRTKNVYQSGAAFFPRMIEEGLWGVMGGDGPANVQFAFRIGVKFDASAATKYVYTAESLTPPGESDPLALLEKTVQARLADKSK